MVLQDEALRARLLSSLGELASQGRTRRAPELLASTPAREPLHLSRPASTVMDGPSLYQHLLERTVMLGARYLCGRCAQWHLSLSSGFVVGTRGEVVISHHTLEDPNLDALAVMTHRGEVYPVTALLADDPERDLSLVRAEGLSAPPLALSREDALPGSDVAVLSHPADRPFVYSRGVVSRLAEATVREGQPPRATLFLAAPFASGSSGAPVVDLAGNVVGVARSIVPVHSRLEGPHAGSVVMAFQLAVPVADLRSLLAPIAR